MLSGVVGYPNPPPTSEETNIILDFFFFSFHSLALALIPMQVMEVV